jgi:hypothetical protein
MSTLGRRAFLLLPGGLASASLAWRADVQPATDDARGAVTLDEFVTLSERLTGRRALDRATAQVYLDAFSASSPDRALLVQLTRGPLSAAVDPARIALERRIIESWYTGIHVVNGVGQVAAYAGALVWTALDQPAPGHCRGETGYWSQPPRATR